MPVGNNSCTYLFLLIYSVIAVNLDLWSYAHHYSTFEEVFELTRICFRFLAPKSVRCDFLSALSLCCMGTGLYFSNLILLSLPPTDSNWEPTEPNLNLTNHWTAFCFICTNVFFGINYSLIETHLFVYLAVWFPGSLENNQAFAVYQYITTKGGAIKVFLYKTRKIPWAIVMNVLPLVIVRS